MTSEEMQEKINLNLLKNLSRLGSILFSTTSKIQVTPAQRQICQLQASKRHICAADYFGWQREQLGDTEPKKTSGSLESYPTPTVGDAMGGRTAKGMSPTGKMPDGRKLAVSLNHVAALASWVTPMACNDRAGNTDFSRSVVSLAAWPTTTAKFFDEKKNPPIMQGRKKTDPQVTLGDVAMLTGPIRVNRFGQMLIGSDAQTETGGQLSPEHVCWMQGFPDAWLYSAPMARVTLTARAVRSKGLATP